MRRQHTNNTIMKKDHFHFATMAKAQVNQASRCFLSCICAREKHPLLAITLFLTFCNTLLAGAALEGKFLRDLRSLQETMSDVAQDTHAHLLELCMDAQGQANPRVARTTRHKHAVSYVEQQMQDMGLIPAGDIGRTTFVQTVDVSVDKTYCPPGI
jgi:hypothetical protein